MAEFIEHFQEVAYISGDSVKRSDQNDIEAMPAGICKKLVETGTLRFGAGNRVCIFMHNFVAALLRQFTKVVELCFCVLVASGNAGVEDRAFAGSGFCPNFDFGRYLLLSHVGWKTGAILFAFYLSMMVSAYWSWESWRRHQQSETVFVNRNQAPFHFSLFIAILGVYVVWFSLHIYPIIPYSFGGGRPLMVQFIESDKPLPASLVRDDKTQRTVPYRLLEATDKSYYVISENQSEQSIEINRDSVGGMVVLKDAAK